jgi:hypothetical protein
MSIGKGYGSAERFLLLPEHILVDKDWRNLPTDARAILVDLCKRYNRGSPSKGFYNNNGWIGYSCRDAESISIGKNAAARALAKIEETSLLDPAGSWYFTADGHRHARIWRITFLPTHGRVPTRRNLTKNTRQIKLYHRWLNSSAYRTTPSAAKVVLLEMMRRFNGGNNGRISFGGLSGAEIGLSRDLTERMLNLLRDRGFLAEMEPAKPGRRGHPRRWRLTMYRVAGMKPTEEFLKWTPAEFSFPVPLARTILAIGTAGADNSARKLELADPSDERSGANNPQAEERDVTNDGPQIARNRPGVIIRIGGTLLDNHVSRPPGGLGARPPVVPLSPVPAAPTQARRVSRGPK